MKPLKQNLRFIRVMMVLSSFFPLFLLWAIIGSRVDSVPDNIFKPICVVIATIPTFFVIFRIYIAVNSDDSHRLVVSNSKDQKDVLIVYLFAMLIPLYQTELHNTEEFIALLVLTFLVMILFYRLNLYYMNIILSVFGYHAFMIQPTLDDKNFNRQIIVISKSEFLKENQELIAFRITDTVFLEKMEN